MADRNRLDALLVARGLAATRARARALVLAGRVRVDDVLQLDGVERTVIAIVALDGERS